MSSSCLLITLHLGLGITLALVERAALQTRRSSVGHCGCLWDEPPVTCVVVDKGWVLRKSWHLKVQEIVVVYEVAQYVRSIYVYIL